MWRLWIVALCAAIAGCQTVQLSTPSQRPEVTVAAPAATVRPILIGEMINHGFRISQDTAYALVMERASQDLMTNVLLGSQWNPTVNARISFAITELDGQTRVVADIFAVTNPGTAFEQLTPFNNSKDAVDFQFFLEGIRTTAMAAAEAARG